MVSPSYEERICEMFDSFSKTVSRNYYRDLLRAENRRNSHYKEEPVEYLFELLGHRDNYPSDFFVLYADGHSCVVEQVTLLLKLRMFLKRRNMAESKQQFQAVGKSKHISKFPITAAIGIEGADVSVNEESGFVSQIQSIHLIGIDVCLFLCLLIIIVIGKDFFQGIIDAQIHQLK